MVLVTALLMKMRKKDTDKVELKEVSVGNVFTSKDGALAQFNDVSNDNQKRIEDFLFDQKKARKPGRKLGWGKGCINASVLNS